VTTPGILIALLFINWFLLCKNQGALHQRFLQAKTWLFTSFGAERQRNFNYFGALHQWLFISFFFALSKL